MSENQQEGRPVSGATTPISQQSKFKVGCTPAPYYDLLYIPSENHFVAITEAEAKLLAVSDVEFDEPMAKKLKADKSKNQKQIENSRDELAKFLNEKITVPDETGEKTEDINALLTGGAGGLIEAVSFKGQKYSLIPKDMYDSFSKQEGKIKGWGKTGIFSKQNEFNEAKHPFETSKTGTGGKRSFDENAIKTAFENEIVAEVKLYEKKSGGQVEVPYADGFNKWVKSVNDNAKVVISRRENLKRDFNNHLSKSDDELDSDDLGRALLYVKQIWGDVEPHKRESWLQSIYTDFDLDTESDISVSPNAELESGENGEQEKVKADIAMLKQYLAPTAPTASPYKIEQSVPDSRFNVTAEAQLMRYAAGATVVNDVDLKKGVVALKAEGQLDFALCEGKVSGQVLIPDEKGHRLNVPVHKKVWESAWKIDDSCDFDPVTFGFNKCFLTFEGKEKVVDLFNTWKSASKFPIKYQSDGKWYVPKGYRIQLVGHADAVGSTGYNQTLSEYRAKIIYGYLCCCDEYWLAMFDVPTEQSGWSYPEIATMLTALGYPVNGTGQEAVSRSMTDFQTRMNLEDIAWRTVELLPLVISPLANVVKLATVLPNFTKHFEQKLPVGSFSVSSHDPTLAVLVKSYMLVKRDMGIVATTACHHETPYYGKGETQLAVPTETREQANRRVSCVLWADKGKVNDQGIEDVPLGDLRLALEASMSKYVGANLMLGAKVNFDASNGVLNAKGVLVNTGAGAGGAFFAGAKAELGCKGGLEWLSPEKLDTNKEETSKFVELGSVGYTATGVLGLSAVANFQIGFDRESKKFIIKAEAQAAFGAGVGGKVAFSVTAKHVYAFLALVYTQLKDNDFNFVDFFEDVDAFNMFCSWSYKMLTKGHLGAATVLAVGAVGMKALSYADDLQRDWTFAFEEKEHAENLIANINTDTNYIKYTTPEVKGRILHVLITPVGWYDWCNEVSWQGVYVEREKAIMEVLSWIQSKRDCQEVLEHMGIGIKPKATEEEKEQRCNENKELLLRWLGEQDVYAADWQIWHEKLPVTAPKGAVKKRTPIKKT